MIQLFGGLSFGWRTAVLLVMFSQLLLLGAALLGVLQNRSANATMAALLVVLAGMITPWMIGFAGFYDKWMWLTFAPFQISLAVAPLFYFYANALVTGKWPENGKWHLMPALAQFMFYTGSFLLPLDIKMQWAELVSPVSYPVISAAVIAGLIYYGTSSLRLLKRYKSALEAARSDDHRYATRWLVSAIAALAILFFVWTIYVVWDWLIPLGYTGLMGLYIAIGVFALYLGVEAWRHATLPFPTLASLQTTADNLPPPRDWKALGLEWAEKVKTEDWAADPELTLPLLARRLGTNSGHLSRAINEGLGVSFSGFVNGLRARRVAEMLEQGRRDDLLDLALEAGFSSKASFNRAFTNSFATSPSEYRKRLKS